MQLKKRIVTMLAGIALLAFGVFTACDTATNPEKANENQKQGGNDSSFIKVETTNEGIKFSYDEIPENISDLLIQLVQKDKKSLTELRINSLTTNYLIDKYVDANTEYDCYISWKNADGTSDGIEPLSVKTTAGLGEVRLSNQPAVSFDSKNNTATFTTLPEFSEISNLDWGCNFGYHLKDSKNEKWCCLYNGISKNDTNVIRTIYDDVEFGTWNRCNYIVWFNCEGFEYKHFEWDDLSKIENMPETMNLVDNKPKLFATPVDEGIKFEWKNIPEGSSNWSVILEDKKSITELKLSSLNVSPITDKYVNPNTEYRCYIQWKNADGNWENSRKISVTPTNGLGEAKITNQPSASFNAQNNKVTFTTLPEFSGVSNLDWGCGIGYRLKESESGKWEGLYFIDKNDTELIYTISGNREFGTWNLCNYIIYFDCEGFEYKHFEYNDLSMLTNIPQTINLVDNKPKLIATPVNEGIKFEWKNIPEGCSNWYVRLNKKDEESLTELRLGSMSATSIIDKYVDANSEYSCYIRWENSDGTWDSSKTISVTPTNGLGEAKITNQPAASFDSQNKTIIFETLPEFSALQDINWRCVFGYKLKETGEWDWIYNAIYKNNSNKVYSIFDETASGNWILCDYIVSFNDDDFEYKHYEDDISELNSIPNPILLSDENRFSLLATPVSDGIKLEWKNLPEGTKKLCIYDTNGFDSLFIINNPSAVNFVTDKYVDSGKKYSYQLRAIDENDREFQVVYANNIFATSGSGEKDITATAEDDGIHITFDKPASDCAIVILKSSSIENIRNSSENFDAGFEGSISDSVSEISFIDSFVTEGEKYSYLPYLREWGTNTNDFVEFPRYSIVTVTARSTGEKLEIINKPSGTYDETSKTLIITNAPQIASIKGAVKWDLCLFYNGYGLIFINDKSTSYTISDIVSSGSRTLNGYSIRLYYGNTVRYHVEKSDVSIFSELPKTITF